MTDGPFYFDPNDQNPKPVFIEYTDDELRRIYQIAEHFAARCIAHGQTPPPDPLRAVLCACEDLWRTLIMLDAVREKSVLDAEQPRSIQ